MYKYFCLLISIAVISGFAQNSPLNIAFSDLPDFTRQHSPYYHQISREYQKRQQDEKIGLQLTNPELEWETENLRDEHSKARDSEMNLKIKKQLSMPWLYAGKKTEWKYLMNSAWYAKKQNELDVLASLKTGYIRIQLVDEKIRDLQHFFTVLEKATDITQNRKTEGAISGLESDVLTLSLKNLGAKLVMLKNHRREVSSSWKVDMGIKTQETIQLVTPVIFFPVNLDSIAVDRMENFSIKTLRAEIMAQKFNVKQQKMSFFPHITAFGGYKRAAKTMDGYVAGVSVPLPVFNLNKPGIQRAEIEKLRLDTALSIHRQTVKERVENLKSHIISLAEFLYHAEPDENIVKNLVYSYHEGWLSLNGLLSSSKVYAHAVDQYYDLLMLYFEHLFELETLVNKELVRFK